MKTTVHFDDFRHAFNSIRPDNFSRESLEQLFDYFEAYERDTGEEIELDVIAICCDYTAQNYKDIAEAYGIDLDDQDSEEDQCKQVKDFLEVETIVIGETDFEIVYQNF